MTCVYQCQSFFFFQAEDGIRDLVRSRGLGDVYKRQDLGRGIARPLQHHRHKGEGRHRDREQDDRSHTPEGLDRALLGTQHRNREGGLSLIHISEPTRPY